MESIFYLHDHYQRTNVGLRNGKSGFYTRHQQRSAYLYELTPQQSSSSDLLERLAVAYVHILEEVAVGAIIETYLPLNWPC